MTTAHFEHFVFSKPYFDRHGLLVMEGEDGDLLGFIHAGFAANESFSDVDHSVGVICQLQISQEHASLELAQQLVRAAESYLRERGCKEIWGGSHPPRNPFYHGLCGSGELAGVLLANELLHECFDSLSYQVVEEFVVMESQLGRMRPVIDRNQRLLPRSFEVRPTLDHTFGNWWETAAYGPIQRSEFQLVRKSDNMVCGSLMWWDLEQSTEQVEPGVAISRLQIADDNRRTGLATYLVSNALKQLKSSGAFRAQVQIARSNGPAIEFFKKLGFVEVDRGKVYRKTIAD